MLWIIPGTAISYLIGSIPTAYIFGRVLKGIDIRKFGSGNVGATNALRVLGKGPGIAVLLLDICKGFMATVFLGTIVALKCGGIKTEAIYILLGVSCICGHNWTIFLNFKGGKGIATTLGVLLGLAVKIGGLDKIILLLILTWFIIFIISRIVSLSSIITAISFPAYMVLFNQPRLLIFLSLALSFIVILRHKPNLTRLAKGQEPRLSFKKTKPINFA